MKGFRVTEAQMRDPAFCFENKAAIEKASLDGTLVVA